MALDDQLWPCLSQMLGVGGKREKLSSLNLYEDLPCTSVPLIVHKVAGEVSEKDY